MDTKNDVTIEHGPIVTCILPHHKTEMQINLPHGRDKLAPLLYTMSTCSKLTVSNQNAQDQCQSRIEQFHFAWFMFHWCLVLNFCLMNFAIFVLQWILYSRFEKQTNKRTNKEEHYMRDAEMPFFLT